MELIKRYEQYIEKMEGYKKELENELKGLSPRALTYDELGYYSRVISDINELELNILMSESAIKRLKITY